MAQTDSNIETANIETANIETAPAGAGTRRAYDRAAASEDVEDYSLRYAPLSFRRWSPFVVANTALGGIAYLADFAIGASIVFTNGAASGIAAILAAALIIFVTGIPIARACATYGVDMDLLTRGAGFGYFGSTLTSLIYASFTFIFFALEGSIMAQALNLWLHIPLAVGYLICALIIVPLVIFGMKALSRMQLWTQPFWLALLVLPFVAIMVHKPGALSSFLHFGGADGQHAAFSWTGFGLGMGVALSLIAQIGEQADFLRFMPARTEANRRSWNAAVIAAGPGWVIVGALKQLGGALLAVAAIATVGVSAAGQPIHQYVSAIAPWLGDASVTVAALFVIMSQIKINSTNAYSGSLSWSNFFSRITHRHPGRVFYVFLNIGVAIVLMESDMFSFLNKILGFYSNIGIAWIGAVVADLVINKKLGWSPSYIEFKRAYLYSINPVGFGSMVVASTLSILAFFKVFGDGLPYAFSPMIALAVAMVLSPLLAWLTKGRYYLARPNTVFGPAAAELDAELDPAEQLDCGICGLAYERPDVADCGVVTARVCSLCCSLESTCHDACKKAGPVLVTLGARHGVA